MSLFLFKNVFLSLSIMAFALAACHNFVYDKQERAVIS